MKATKVSIKYNPFTVKTEIFVNDKNVINGPLKELILATENRRLQQWIDKVIPIVIKTYNTQNIDFQFEGTEFDAIDVKEAIKNHHNENKRVIINQKYATYNCLVDEKVKKLKNLFRESQDGPFEEFRSDDMRNAFEKALAPEFEVNVIATMSSGKSTVINAMLGMELMPAKNEACTATIAKIYDTDDSNEFVGKRIGHDNSIIDNWKPIDKNIVNNWNSDPNTSIIEIRGNIPAINERPGMRIVLVDTPGPNNSRDDNHRRTTIQAIRGTQPSMVLYILNATQLSTNDDLNLLNEIKDAMQEGGREAQERFVFVANKIDAFDPEKGESVGSALKNVRDYLTKNGIKNPMVIPASAELAKLLRIKVLFGADKLTRSQKGNLSTFTDLFTEESEMNMLEHIKNDLDSQTYRYLKKQLDEYESADNKDKVAEIRSGIPIVEKLLDNYISKYAIPARIKDAVDTFSTVAAKSNALEKTNSIISKSQEEIAALVKMIEQFNNNQNKLSAAQNFRQKVKDMKYELAATSKSSRSQIDRKVNDLLDEFMSKLSEEVKPSYAELLMQKSERDINHLVKVIEEILSENLEKDLSYQLNSMRQEYQKYIVELLEREFPDNEMKIVKDFQRASMEMTDVKTMVQAATYEKKNKRFIRTERYGFLWLKKRDVYETTYEDFVDMSKLAKELERTLQNIKMNNFTQFEKTCKDNFEMAKEVILSQMDEIDRKVENNMLEITDSVKNKEKQEQLISENQRKIEWYQSFSNKLNSILDIKE
jgi:hypothetical protein